MQKTYRVIIESVAHAEFHVRSSGRPTKKQLLKIVDDSCENFDEISVRIHTLDEVENCPKEETIYTVNAD